MHFLTACLLSLALLTLPACSLVRSGSQQVATQASHDGKLTSLSLEDLRGVFTPGKAAIADAYFTNLPEAALSGEANLSQASGVMLHAHILTQPKAGRTPIATTATTTTLRLLIVSNGQAGLYAGGGFADFDVDGEGEKSQLSGRIRSATLRLVRATQGFSDVLGPCTLTINADAKNNPAQCAAADRAITALIDAMEEIP